MEYYSHQTKGSLLQPVQTQRRLNLYLIQSNRMEWLWRCLLQKRRHGTTWDPHLWVLTTIKIFVLKPSQDTAILNWQKAKCKTFSCFTRWLIELFFPFFFFCKLSDNNKEIHEHVFLDWTFYLTKCIWTKLSLVFWLLLRLPDPRHPIIAANYK